MQRLIDSDHDARPPVADAQPVLSASLAQANAVFPFSSAETLNVYQVFEITSYLPEFQTATDMVEFFISMHGWVNLPVDRDQIHNDLLPMFYPGGVRIVPHLAQKENLDDLALLYTVLAIGCDQNILSLGKPSELSDQYRCLARAALGARGLFEHGSLSAVQTLVLLSTFEVYSWRPNAQETAWKLKAVGLFIASSVSGSHLREVIAAD